MKKVRQLLVGTVVLIMAACEGSSSATPRPAPPPYCFAEPGKPTITVGGETYDKGCARRHRSEWDVKWWVEP